MDFRKYTDHQHVKIVIVVKVIIITIENV